MTLQPHLSHEQACHSYINLIKASTLFQRLRFCNTQYENRDPCGQELLHSLQYGEVCTQSPEFLDIFYLFFKERWNTTSCVYYRFITFGLSFRKLIVRGGGLDTDDTVWSKQPCRPNGEAHRTEGSHSCHRRTQHTNVQMH